LCAHAYNLDNATIQIYIDGKKVGSNYDLSSGGNNNYPYHEFNVGTIELAKYSEHQITVVSLIPGYLSGTGHGLYLSNSGVGLYKKS